MQLSVVAEAHIKKGCTKSGLYPTISVLHGKIGTPSNRYTFYPNKHMSMNMDHMENDVQGIR